MKFLIIASAPLSLLNFRAALLKRLQDYGFEIHVAAPEFSLHPEESKKLSSLGYIVHDIAMQRTGTNPLSDLNTIKDLYKLITDIKPNYVLSYTIKPVIYGTLAAWMARVPHRFALITGLGYAFQNVENKSNRNIFQRAVHTLYKTALAKSDKVIFQNPDDLQLFKHLNLIHSNQPTAVVNGSGVDVSEFNVAPIPMADNQPEVRFLLIARLIGDKGVREYAQAAKIIKNKYPHVKFDLVGEIDSNPSAIKQSELDEWVDEGLFHYWGRLDDVRPAIKASSVYVLPSYREGTPRTVLESMAMGRPTITTDAPGCRQTVKEGYNGFLVPVKSVDKLADAMEKFVRDPSLIESMGKAGRKVAEEKFDVHAVNNVMLNEMGLSK